MNDSDPVAAYERLKIETAAMLNLSTDSASLVENLQVSLVAILRMEVDTLEGQVLAGDSVDLKRLEIALGMLRSLLPAQALVSAPPPAEVRFSGEHQRKLRAMIEKTVLAASATEHADIAERQWRDEQQALAAALPDWRWKPAPAGGDGLAAATPSAAGGDASGGGVLGSSPSRAPAGGPPATAPPPPRQTSA
jgi:hypothetical protein